jgi:methylenetetrahydrofolate dehydrogenase (NADP+)/methenyltetrahydrofolate cyclohydrolase
MAELPEPRELAELIDGKATAAQIRAQVTDETAALKTGHDIVPGLAVVLVGDDPASQVYVRNKERQATEAGMWSVTHRLSAETGQDDLLETVASLNADPTIHGILVQLPLPGHLDPSEVVDAIDPAKDVDGLTLINVARLAEGLRAGPKAAIVPATPLGVEILLKRHAGSLRGQNAVVLGRSNLVGRPVAQLLLHADCTVTVAHSKTRAVADVCRSADILIAAVGRPQMVTGDWIKPGATVIDVGINRVAAPTDEDPGKTRLVGDVDFETAQQVAGAITPVPGGVGPMTIACLLTNTLVAACRINGLEPPKIT